MTDNRKIVIEVTNASLLFPIMRSKSLLFRDLFFGRWKKLKTKKHYKALDNLTFEVRSGEVLGIVGPNGSGKSTLLKLIAGIYVPESGVVTANGIISLLAGLGAGFQSNLSGRDNIMLSGSIYGFSVDELKKLTPSIIEYSGVEEFIDQPLRTYSSGMRARLAFSITSHIEPDILLIDEVIAVGDSAFKKKSMNRIKELAKGKSTIIIVSHSQSLLNIICDRIMCLDNGRLDCITDDKEFAINRYHDLSNSSKN